MIKKRIRLEVLSICFISVSLCLLLFLAGCTTPTGGGSLLEKKIEVGGLPAGINADITVTGPNGFSEKIIETKVLKLSDGNYTIDAKDVTVGETTYFVILAEEQKTFESSYYSDVQVLYEPEANLTVTVRGLPAGTNADISLKGTYVTSKPEGIEQKLTSTTTLSDVRPGLYEIRASELSSDFVYTPRVNLFQMLLDPGKSMSVTIDYLTKTEVFAGLEGGNAIAIDGNTMATSSLTEVDKSSPFYRKCVANEGPCIGTVTVLQKDASGVWEPVKTLTSDSIRPERPDMFGYAVAISGDMIAVGAYRAEGFAGDEGAVYIFQRNQGGVNNWGLLQKLTKANSFYDPVTGRSGSFGHSFGTTVVLSKDTLVVGDPTFTYDANGDGRTACTDTISDECSAGAVFVYRYDSSVNQWISETQLRPSDLVVIDPSRQYQASSFGSSVSITDDTIFAGAPRRNADAGAVYIFSRDSLTELQRLEGIKTQEVAFPYFGTALAASGDTLVVSAPNSDSSVSGAVVYAFQKNQATNIWQEAQKISPANESHENIVYDTGFGTTLALNGGVLAVGKPRACYALLVRQICCRR
jgi:hypothetical protein